MELQLSEAEGVEKVEKIEMDIYKKIEKSDKRVGVGDLN